MVSYRGRLIRYTEVYFGETAPKTGCDAIIHAYRPAPIPNAWCQAVWSLVVDIGVSEEALVGGFKKGTRYEVRRADSRDGLTATHCPNPSPDELASFFSFFSRFAARIGLEDLRRTRIQAYADGGRLVLSRATKDGEDLVWHAYSYAGSRVLLLHSAQTGGDDAEGRALVGRANRWLHWRDMLHFRAAGFRHYDLGGWYEGEEDAKLLAINAFKEQFGGERVREFECYEPVTLWGRLFLTARRGPRRSA